MTLYPLIIRGASKKNMIAFINLGGHQHRVEKDSIFLVEKTGHPVGEEFLCKEVMFIAKGDDSKIAGPELEQVKVKLKVLEDLRAPKIYGFKYKKRKGYRRRWGHRQDLQKIQVTDLAL